MAVKTPDFKIKNGLQVGAHTTLKGGVTADSYARFKENVSLDKDMTIAGNLTVTGDTVTVETSAVAVEDPLLSLGLNNGADLKDIGFYGRYHDGANPLYAGIYRDTTEAGLFRLFHSLSAEPTTNSVDATDNSFTKATLQADLSGNADTASQLEGSVTVNFQGDTTGTGAITGSITNIKGLENGGVQNISTSMTMVPNAVGTDNLKTDSVTEPKIADDAVTNAKIDVNAINQEQLSTFAVHQQNIKPGNIGEQHYVSDSIANSALADDCIALEQMQVDSVDTLQVKNNAITHDKMANAAINTPELSTFAVEAIKIKPANVGEQHYSSLSIGTSALKSNAVTLAKMGGDSVGEDQYIDRSVGNDAIALSSINMAHLSAANGSSALVTINGTNRYLGESFTVGAISDVVDSHSVDMSILTASDGSGGVQQSLSANVLVDDSTIEVNTALSSIQVKDMGVTHAKLLSTAGVQAVITNVIRDLAVTTAKINTDAVTTAKILNQNVTEMKILSSTTTDDNRAIGTHHIKDQSVTSDKLADGAVGDTQLALTHAQFTTLSGTADTTESTFNTTLTSNYRSTEYFIQANKGGDYQASLVTLLHNGADVWVMEHGMVHTTNDPFMTYTADMDSGAGTMRLRATASGGTAYLKAVKTSVES